MATRTSRLIMIWVQACNASFSVTGTCKPIHPAPKYFVWVQTRRPPCADCRSWRLSLEQHLQDVLQAPGLIAVKPAGQYPGHVLAPGLGRGRVIALGE